MKTFISITLLFAALIFSGCGSGKVPTQGTVKFTDGTPLAVGTVCMSNGQRMYEGKIRADGTFSLGELRDGDGIPPGTYKVWIANSTLAENVYDKTGEVVQKIIETPTVNPKHTTKETSDLTFTAEKGKKNRIDINVEKP